MVGFSNFDCVSKVIKSLNVGINFESKNPKEQKFDQILFVYLEIILCP